METIVKDGVNYPLVVSDINGKIKCPFCQETHKHGKEEGHRIPHCESPVINNPIFHKDGWCKKENGYYIKFNKEDNENK
jgi:hypothetical protein